MSDNLANLTISPSDIINGTFGQLPLLNVTRGLPDSQVLVVLLGIFTPVFFVITLIANSMIIVVCSCISIHFFQCSNPPKCTHNRF